MRILLYLPPVALAVALTLIPACLRENPEVLAPVAESDFSAFDTPPVLVEFSAPVYPEAAQGAEGTVLVRAVIGPDGGVLDAEAIRSPRNDFAASAVEALKRCVFKPATLDGKPVRAVVMVPFRFST